MRHGDTAQLAALVGAVGALLVLLPARRSVLLTGLALLAAAEAGFAYALVPGDDRELLLTRASGVALLLAGTAGVALLAYVFVRVPAVVPVAILAVAPFRIPVELGDQRAFLLLPLYGVLASAVLALALRAFRDERLQTPPAVLAIPAGAFVSLAGISLLWSSDLRAGSIALGFFLFPFAGLLAVVLRTPLAPWTTRALAVTAVALAAVFAAIGLWQARTRELFFAPDLEVANAYTTFFRVTSLFKDPSLYGRYLVVGIAVLLVALWLGRVRFWVAAALVGFLFAGLWYSYSQSSLTALFVIALAIPIVLGDRRTRLALGGAAAVCALIGAGLFVRAALTEDAAQRPDAGRARLVERTATVIRDHPLVGVGVGAQPFESARAAGSDSVSRNASHTTPLTVAAELGVPGVVAYLAFLAAAAWALLALVRVDRPLGLGLAAVFLVLVFHSLLYSGFFEDPLTWGVVAVTGAALATRGVALRFPRPVLPPARAPAPSTSTAARARALRLPLARRRQLLLVTGAVVLAAAGLALGLVTALPETTEGELDTRLEDVSVFVPPTLSRPPPTAAPSPNGKPAAARRRSRSRKLALKTPGDRCWRYFGGNPQRTQSRLGFHLGRPTRPVWARGLKGYIEYQPSYCDGTLYVNTYRGDTFALDARTGETRWRRRVGGAKPSTPAIAGDRLIVSSVDGTVSALNRKTGRLMWQLRTRSKVESSPVVIGRMAYFGATDGRLFAVYAGTGRVKWAFDTGGRINSSPSVYGARICITTYAGSIFCLRRSNGQKLWSRYVKRDAFRYESFYASASTDGRRLFTIARSGKVVALSARTGKVIWTQRIHSLGYSTPAVAYGRVFVGGFDGRLHVYRARDGVEVWSRWVGGRILGAPVVVGRLVFFSTLEQKTYAARVGDGRLVWRFGMGKYSPGIATEDAYYFALNGIVVAFRGRLRPTPLVRDG